MLRKGKSTFMHSVFIGALLLSMVAAFPTPSAAGHEGGSGTDGNHGGESEAGAVAQGLGISEAAARRAIGMTSAVHRLEATAVEEFGATFAGIWRDYSSGEGRVKLAFTTNASDKRARLVKAFPAPEMVDSLDAVRTLAELDGIRDMITGEIPLWRERGLDIVSIASDLPSNRVAVAIKEWNNAAVDELRQKYGSHSLQVQVQPALNAVADGCEARDACALQPLRGGLWVTFPLDNSMCTTAFVAHRGGQGGPAGVLSAGHCSLIDRPAEHSGIPMGAVAWQQYSGKVDGLWIDSVDTWATSRWVWQEPTNHRYTITSRSGEGAGVIGDPICHSGARRGYRCGQITDDHITVSVNGRTFTDMKQDNICTGPGDSGGPAYANHRAHGIISFSNSHINEDNSYRCRTVAIDGYPTRTTYTGIYNTEQAFGVIVRTW